MRLLFASVLAGAVALSACAPRMQGTHYERWAGQDAKRRAERAAEEAAEKAAQGNMPAPGSSAKTGPMVAPSKPASQPPPPPPPPGDDYDSLSGSPTPPVRTATKSRAIKPAEEDDAIY